jgi:hypothetical protein
MRNTCGTCRFWYRNLFVTGSRGDCFRRAPNAIHALAIPSDNPRTEYENDPALAVRPATNETSWCGEHESKPKPAMPSYKAQDEREIAEELYKTLSEFKRALVGKTVRDVAWDQRAYRDGSCGLELRLNEGGLVSVLIDHEYDVDRPTLVADTFE